MTEPPAGLPPEFHEDWKEIIYVLANAHPDRDHWISPYRKLRAALEALAETEREREQFEDHNIKLIAERDQLRAEVERLKREHAACPVEALKQEVQVLTDEQGQLVMENERLKEEAHKGTEDMALLLTQFKEQTEHDRAAIAAKDAALDNMIEWALLNEDSHFGEPIPEDQLNDKFKADLRIAREARSR